MLYVHFNPTEISEFMNLFDAFPPFYSVPHSLTRPPGPDSDT